jgi:hypothetical protein
MVWNARTDKEPGAVWLREQIRQVVLDAGVSA